MKYLLGVGDSETEYEEKLATLAFYITQKLHDYSLNSMSEKKTDSEPVLCIRATLFPNQLTLPARPFLSSLNYQILLF